MMITEEPIFCGGILPDGSTCHATEFRERLPQGSTKWPQRRGMAWYYAEGNCWVDFCPVCGTKLGVTEDGRPTTEQRIVRTAEDIIRYYEDDLLDAVADHPEAGKPIVGSWVDAFAEWLYGKGN